MKYLLMIFILFFATYANAINLEGVNLSSVNVRIPSRVMVAGDSNAWGGVGLDLGWRGLLQEKLSYLVDFVGQYGKEEGFTESYDPWEGLKPDNYVAFNGYLYPGLGAHYSFPGMYANYIVDEGRAILRYVQESEGIEIFFPNPSRHDTLMIECGANDILFIGDKGGLPEFALDGIDRFVDYTKNVSDEINIFIMSLYPFYDDDNATRTTRKNQDVIDFNVMLSDYVDASGKANLYYIDVNTDLSADWDSLVDSYTVDGIHANAAGLEVVAEIIYQTMKTNNLDH